MYFLISSTIRLQTFWLDLLDTLGSAFQNSKILFELVFKSKKKKITWNKNCFRDRRNIMMPQ